MSSSRRDEQSNVFQIFPKRNLEKKSSGIKYGQIIKKNDLNAGISSVPVQVSSFVPVEMMGKRVSRSEVLPASVQSQSKLAVENLKQNFKILNDLQARLRFMLQELEEIIKD